MHLVGPITRALVVAGIVSSLVTVANAKTKAHARRAAKHRAVAVGHSVGVPWQGRLRDPAQFPEGDGYHIRRPWRSFGTRRTVELVHRVVTSVIERFPEKHVLAIGDFSAEHGGPITEHASHQSGRDVDIGLYYNEKPAAYPASFVSATADNLDREATWALVDRFVRTADEPGGAQLIFLDFRVQGLLYDWAKEHGVSEERLDRVFQYPHGRGSSDGFVRHWPNHDNHIHVRFRCRADDTGCR